MFFPWKSCAEMSDIYTKKFGNPHFLFHKMISFSNLNYFHDLKKILPWQKNLLRILKNFGITEFFKIRKLFQNTNRNHFMK